VNRTLNYRTRFLVGTALAALLGVGLSSMLLASARRAVARERAERAAIIATLGMKDVADHLWAKPDQLRAAVARFSTSTGAAVRVVAVDSADLVASSFAKDVGDQAAPRHLGHDEKALYDRSQTLRAAVVTNKEEKSAQRAEIDVTPVPDRGFSVAAPVESDVPAPAQAAPAAPEDQNAPPVDLGTEGEPTAQTGGVVGIVEVEMPPAAPAPGGSIPLAVLAVLFPIALVALASLFLGRSKNGLLAVSVVLLAIALAGYDFMSVTAVSDDLHQAVGEVAGDLERVQTGVTEALQAAGSSEQLNPAHWNADLYRRPIETTGDLDADAAQLGHRLGVGQREAARSLGLVDLLALALLLFVGTGGASKLGRTIVEHRQAYLYILPAVIGTLLLVFFPFTYGIVISFTDQNIYNTNKALADIWVGFRNYIDILGDFSILKSGATGFAINYQNFYYTLLFTIFWTITNVVYGVTVGLVLALCLNQKIAARPIYRVLLIFPWAMPNYITALIWKGMFHQQFGVVNQIVQLIGLQPVAWFDKPLTSFFTAWAANGWLSFPFMMVVSLGALQSIPADIYEAARVDGATNWQQFWAITLPSLRSALVPAVILSVVWTFNMFNIIFLVTGGEPGGSTEILVTQAYKFAFERYRYGYAAAYSTIIFGILLIYGSFQNRISRGTEAA
jgi:arabinogalactan oligomer/maltooligosaccharide transport system permease protein